MKRIVPFIVLSGICMVALFSFNFALNTRNGENMHFSSEKYDALWKKVDSLLQSEGLVQSARAAADTIYTKAKAENSTGEMVKALITMLHIDASREEDAYIKAIQRIQSELKNAKAPVSSILNVLLAEHYWQYYQQNRWKFLNRTQTITAKSNDISTWDLSTIVESTLCAYAGALEQASALKKIPIHELGPLTLNGDSTDVHYRPTLFDLVAHRAIDFYINEEPEITRPSYKFELDAEKYFSPISEFITIPLVTKDSLSMKCKALKLFQDLLTFHKNDRDVSALVDVNLKRLAFVKNASVLELNDELYSSALIELGKKFKDQEVSSEISYQLAQHYASLASTYTSQSNERYRWYYKKANDLCDEAIKRFPESYGAQMCISLKSSINSKQFNISNESVVPPQCPFKLTVKYKSISKLYWRLIPIQTDAYKKLIQSDYSESLYSKIASKKALHSSQVMLPDPGDFMEHSVEVMIPVVPVGLYILLVSSEESFSTSGNILSYSPVRCSRISYFSKSQQNGAGNQQYYVRDRENGTPLADVTADVWLQEYSSKKRAYIDVKYGTYRTDLNGFFTIPVSKNEQKYGQYHIRFSKENDELYNDNNNYLSPYVTDDKNWYTRTWFFTDRSLYRPGQTVYFKGIMISTNNDSSKVVAGAPTVVSFYDVNGEEIGKAECVTNQYGTFNGTFTTPVGVLTGSMRIGNEHGETQINVEEYKRPKFEVTFKPVEGSYRCGDKITIKGVAKTYSGSPVGGANVQFHVTRVAEFPYWWCWWRIRPATPAMEIAHGTITTSDTGEYAITFQAIPDRSVQRSDNPHFTYSVTASVTDINGETREASTSVSAGYSSVNISVGIPTFVNKQVDNKFSIMSKNSNGAEVPSKGTIEISQLEVPSKILRSRMPYNAQIDTAIMSREVHDTHFPTDIYSNENEWSTWKVKEPVYKCQFNTEKDSEFTLSDLKKWKQGAYIVKAYSKDTYGQEVSDTRYFTLYDENEKMLPYSSADWFVNLNKDREPGEKARFLVGSSYTGVQALWEIEHNGKITHSEWVTLSNNQKILEFPIKEQHRGNVVVHYTFIRDNRFYAHNEVVIVPWTNKELTIDFETFRDKLQPGEHEEWRLKINGPDKEKVTAEMVLALYDASLDAFRYHGWNFSIYPCKSFYSAWDAKDCFSVLDGMPHNSINSYASMPVRNYPVFYWGNYDFYYAVNHQGIGYGAGYGAVSTLQHLSKSKSALRTSTSMSAKSAMAGRMAPPPHSAAPAMVADMLNEASAAMTSSAPAETKPMPVGGSGTSVQDLANVKARNNLNETAFFYPTLQTDKDGSLIVKFTIPEALTKWKMLGFAHTKDLKYSLVSKELITQKELMVEPNMPRFFREYDTLDLSAKLVNLSKEDITGSAQLMLFDASTMKPVDSLFGNVNTIQQFSVKKGLNTVAYWRMVIPEGAGPVSCRIVAKSGIFSDGEEKIIPVLSDRMLVTESMPLPVRKKGTREFSFEKLISQNAQSSTLRNHKVTLEFTSNPVWYAVQSIPYLLEYPYECAEQTFARYYANSIATHIMNSNPRIKAVFETWKIDNAGALLSSLQKNQELKGLLLEETPWLLEGKTESENKKRLGLLFDLNTMTRQLDQALDRLKKMQLGNGGWPWFDGMPDNRYITQHILSGFAKLQKLHIVDVRNDHELFDCIKRAVEYCDDRTREDYAWILKHGVSDKDNLRHDVVQYLYMRSCFNDIEPEKKNLEAYNYFVKQAESYWLNKDIYMQGMLACALFRIKKSDIPEKIYRSLKERALVSEEMGMYWKQMYENQGWYWYQAPIETQAVLIEMFEEVARDSTSVDDMKAWMLKSKQTQNWNTTKATTDAIYALLLRGESALSADMTTIIEIGSEIIDLSKGNVKTEAGTGYFKTSWDGDRVKPEMGKIKVTRKNDGVAWGSVYWQYFERLDKITSHITPLSLKRSLFKQVSTDHGLKLESLSPDNLIKVGDKIIIRIELRADRDMEYVHMKDMRSSGFEPVNVLSGYRYQDGLGYYESTRDASTNFFFSSLQKGTYVFEYPVFATHAGVFSNGITSIQCMYAPEFTSHSDGMRVKVVNK